MVALPQQFNTVDLPDTGGTVPLITPGQYPAVIVKSELLPTKNKQGSFLALTNVITQGPFQGTEFVERLNIINQNAQAVEIAYKTLARISEAVGMTQTPRDSNELHNKPFIIEVTTEPGEPYVGNDGQTKQGKDKSIIKKYLPLPKTGVAPVASVGQPVPFSFPPPVQQQNPAAFSPMVTATPAGNPFAQQQVQVASVPVANPFAPPQGQ